MTSFAEKQPLFSGTVCRKSLFATQCRRIKFQKVVRLRTQTRAVSAKHAERNEVKRSMISGNFEIFLIIRSKSTFIYSLQPLFSGGKVYIKFDLKRIIKKFQNSRNHAPFAAQGFAQAAAKLHKQPRAYCVKPHPLDCGNRSEFASQIPTLFEISCADIAWHISFFYRLTAA